MKKKSQAKNNGQKVLNILNRIDKKVGKATVDLNEIKGDLKSVKLRLTEVEYDTSIIKADIENLKKDVGSMKEDIKKMDRNIDDLIENTSEILLKMVSQEEFQKLSKRVTSLEQQ